MIELVFILAAVVFAFGAGRTYTMIRISAAESAFWGEMLRILEQGRAPDYRDFLEAHDRIIMPVIARGRK